MTGGGRGSRLWVSPRLSVMAVTNSIGTVRVWDLPVWDPLPNRDTAHHRSTPLAAAQKQAITLCLSREMRPPAGNSWPKSRASEFNPAVVEGSEVAEHMGPSATRNATYAATLLTIANDSTPLDSCWEHQCRSARAGQRRCIAWFNPAAMGHRMSAMPPSSAIPPMTSVG